MNGLSKFLLFSAAALSFYACKEEEPFGQETTPKNVISFIVRGDEATTKAAAGATVMNPVDLSVDCGVDGLMLTETISSMDDGYFEETPAETKGTPVYTENFDFIKVQVLKSGVLTRMTDRLLLFFIFQRNSILCKSP